MVIHRVVVVAVAAAAVACSEAPSPLAPEAPELSVAGIGHLVAGSGHVQTASGLREFTFHAAELDGEAAGIDRLPTTTIPPAPSSAMAPSSRLAADTGTR